MREVSLRLDAWVVGQTQGAENPAADSAAALQAEASLVLSELWFHVVHEI